MFEGQVGLLLSTGEVSGTGCFLGQLHTLCSGMEGTAGPLWFPQPWEGSLSSPQYSPGVVGQQQLSSKADILLWTGFCLSHRTVHLLEKF